MEKLKQKLQTMDFAGAFKHWLIACLCVVVLGGGVCGFLLQTQLRQALQAEQRAAPYTERVNVQNAEAPEAEGHGVLGEDAALTPPSLAAKAAVGITALLCAVLVAVYWLLVAAWLYRAAGEAEMNAVLWALLGLAGNLIAVALFFLLRSRKPCCPSCGHRQSEGVFCRRCGAALRVCCPACGKTIRLDDRFCPHCGKGMEAAQ